ncbi:MAG: hypothetical protein QNJ97_09490 [Myxococcota bacterium]|nr:hypothetical protein [Myxococcota bacterium]
MRFGLSTLGLVVAALLWSGCDVKVGDGTIDGGVDISAGFSWSWTVTDAETNQTITCEDAGADYTHVRITDADGVVHENFYWLCSGMAGETDGWDIATGTGTVVASLVTVDNVVLSQTAPFEYDFQSGQMSNDLGIIDFPVEFWDPVTEADANIAWQWRVATDPNWEQLIADAEPADLPTVVEAVSDAFTEAEGGISCADFGIDYVTLWVWNPENEQWWTDATATQLPCNEMDHVGDPEEWGIYSGLFIDNFLVAGSYQFYLGFYGTELVGETETADVLLYWDTAGMVDSDKPGDLSATEDNFIGWTILEQEETEQLGVLKVDLLWGSTTAADTFGTCAESGVQEMGFVLSSGDWVAAEVELGDGLECLNQIQFEEVPVLDPPYELLVSGLSAENEILWYHICTGLTPTPGVTLEEAAAYTCQIPSQASTE